jgi:nucleoside-diphosphate-sugar epimerase
VVGAATTGQSEQDQDVNQGSKAVTSLVTGGAGFIGAHVTRECLTLGHSVIVLDDLSGGFRENVPDGATLVQGSIADHTMLARLFEEHHFTFVSHEDPYGIAKLAVEQELRVTHEMFGLDYVIFRPHNVYGEYQNLGDRDRNVVDSFMNQLIQASR